MSDPTSDPNFSGVKQPSFDALVAGHGQAASALNQLQYQLWLQLRKLRVDESPAVRIRRLGALVGSEAADLRRRQSFVKNMDKPGGSPAMLCTTKGTFWRIPVGRPGGEPDLSYELNDAEGLPLPNVDPGGTRFSPEQDAVLSWIELHRNVILQEARRRNIPPEAITAAIAWEAIKNNRLPFQNPIPPTVPVPLRRKGTGPGKMHVNDPEAPLPRQLEGEYLPPLTVAERDRVLSTPEGSVRYIAAAMGGFADLADKYRSQHADRGMPDVRNDILMLTQLYQGSDLGKWELRLDELARTPQQEKLQFGNDMPKWVYENPEFVAGMREALHGTAPPPQQVEPWLPPGPSPTPPGMNEPTSPAPSAPAPTPGPSPRN
jgi:hypothetical protein